MANSRARKKKRAKAKKPVKQPKPAKKPKKPAKKPAKKPKQPSSGSSGVQYGVLRGSVARGKREPDRDKPHYTIFIAASDAKNQQAVVNVRSSVGAGSASEVLFFVDPNLLGQSPDHSELQTVWKKKTTALAKLPLGFTSLPNHTPGIALDYVREAYMHRDEMQHQPASGPGDNDDVQDQLDFWIKKAAADSAIISVFGSGFRGGIHDVHMNQGNKGSFKKDNGIFQDGGIVLAFPSGNFVGIFVAFQAQSFDTDESGNPA